MPGQAQQVQDQGQNKNFGFTANTGGRSRRVATPPT